MRKMVIVVFVIAGLLSACGGNDSDTGDSASVDPTASAAPTASAEPTPVILATTTSTQDSGLLDVLVPAFTDATGYVVQTIAVGSGAAIEMGARGEADVVLAHSPAAEEELVASGVTGDRVLVMHNDFVILGPAADPAGIAGAADAIAAMTAIAESQAPFASRGDDSGTHALELQLWDTADISPSWAGYVETGQGMGATITVASEGLGYTIADRGTHLATTGQPSNTLEVLIEGDPLLFNPYHVIPISDQAGGRVNTAGGAAFAEWIVAEEAQTLIGAFTIGGEALFTPDAGLSLDDLREAA